MPGLPGPAGAAGPEGPGFTASDDLDNTVVGLEALHELTSGLANTAGGSNALQRSNDGTAQTAVGASALRNGSSGGLNTALGFEALVNSDGLSIVALGRGASRDHTGLNFKSNIYIGNVGLASEAGMIRIGTPNTHTQTHLAGTVTAPAFVGDGSALTNVHAVYQ